MIRFAREFRLIPIVLIATICLFALKVSGLVFDGGYTLAERMKDHAKNGFKIQAAESVPQYPRIVVADGASDPATATAGGSWAQQMFNYNGDSDSRDVTGSVDKQARSSGSKSPKPEPAPTKSENDSKLKPSGKAAVPPKLDAGGTVIPIVPGQINSPGERAILGSLQKRREQLDARARDLDMRESLLKAAEQRVEGKVAELKNVEAKVKVAEVHREKVETKRFKGIISMYENMKPKDAARIFDRLDMKILIEVSTRMNPRAMSAILAQMAPEAAERLTVELATRASGQPLKQDPKQLPKIEGKPNGL